MKNVKTLSELEKSGVKFAVIKIDETEYWREDIKEQAKQIFGVYLVDLTKPTHLCSIETNFPAEQIKNFIPNTEGLTEDFIDSVEILDEPDYPYFTEHSSFIVEKEYTEGEFEEAFENEQCNPCVC